MIVFTVASREVKDNPHLILSIKEQGFQLEVLGRTEAWGGFDWRVRQYISALSGIKDQIVVLCDYNDLFFHCSSEQLLGSYYSLARNGEIVIGGEKKIWYQGNRYSNDEISSFFSLITRGEQRYPNGGFLMGPSSILLSILEQCSNQPDDQAAYIDYIMSGGHEQMIVDSYSRLVLNVPNYEDEEHPEPLVDSPPRVYHFPGWRGDTAIMKKFFRELKGTEITSNTGWLLLVILAAMVILICLVR